MPSERADDGIDALVCARLGPPADTVIPRPSTAYPREHARPDLVAAMMGMVWRESDFLVQGVGYLLGVLASAAVPVPLEVIVMAAPLFVLVSDA